MKPISSRIRCVHASVSACSLERHLIDEPAVAHCNHSRAAITHHPPAPAHSAVRAPPCRCSHEAAGLVARFVFTRHAAFFVGAVVTAVAGVDLLLQPVDVSEQALHLQGCQKVIVLHMVWFARELEDDLQLCLVSRRCASHSLHILNVHSRHCASRSLHILDVHGRHCASQSLHILKTLFFT